MKKIKNAIILAAGKSTRYGENKLLKKIEGKTLPQYAVEFCLDNGIENIYVTLSKSNIDSAYSGFGNKPLSLTEESMKDFLKPYTYWNNIEYKHQHPQTYGPAAAILPHLDDISGLDGDFIVLFGDNYYKGKLPDMGQYKDATCLVSSLNKKPNYKNLQYACIKKNILIEKPHSEIEGDFFCGYAIFDFKDAKEKIKKIEISGRSEFEITDFINSMDNVQIVPNELTWGELTYKGDEANIIKLIKGTK